MKILTILVYLLSYSICANAEIWYLNTGKSGITAGILKKGIFYQKQEIEQLNDSASNLKLIEFLKQKAENGSTLLFYSYSFLGNVEPYLSRSLKRIQKHFLSHPEGLEDATLIVLFRPIYPHTFQGNHAMAYRDGRRIAPVFEHILNQVVTQSNKKPKIKILAHSMGNRFLEGILESRNTSSVRIDQLILAAPDVAENTPLVWAKDKHIAQITMYINSADLFLNISGNWLNSVRAGRPKEGLAALIREPAIKVIEVKQVVRFPRTVDLSGHVYFLFSGKVRKDIQAVIHETRSIVEREITKEGYLRLK